MLYQKGENNQAMQFARFSLEKIFFFASQHTKNVFLHVFVGAIGSIFPCFFLCASLWVSVSWFVMCSYSIYEFMLCFLWCLKNEGVKTYLQFQKLIERETIQYNTECFELSSCARHMHSTQYAIHSVPQYTYIFEEMQKLVCVYSYFCFVDDAEEYTQSGFIYAEQLEKRSNWIILSNTSIFFQLINLYLSQCSLQRTASLYANQTTTYHLTFFSKIERKKKNCAQRNSSLFIFFFCIPIIRMFTCYYRANTQSIHIFHLTINEMKIQNVPITLCAFFFRVFWNSRAVFHSINGQF